MVLMGFSLGAAIGLKILEHTDKIDFAFMFYGFPPLETVRPSNISALTTVYVGSEDKIKYISNKVFYKKAEGVYTKNKKIIFKELEKGKHGFINPACTDYNEQLFAICCDDIYDKIGKFGGKMHRSKERDLVPSKIQEFKRQGKSDKKIEDLSDFKGVSERDISYES